MSITRSRRTRLLSLAAVLVPALAGAQPRPAAGDSAARFAVWGAGTGSAPLANHETSHTRVIAIMGVEQRRPWRRGAWGTTEFAPAVLPAVYTTGNIHVVGKRSCGVLELCAVLGTYDTYGFGIVPLALRAGTTPLAGVLRVTARLDGGGIWLRDRIPTEDGTQFNFLAQAGAGLELRLHPRAWLSVEYRHLHVSNGGRGYVNPGIDAPLLALGLAWR